ncbi:transcription factor RelB [Catharus ustulatus]|uniref:transcription factor RelB n=1 Tax=Catharus ustulatus TaxID=91951 RepID=UPI00140DB572|nr:transcription factor RelB [Catharus ustulatus]
MALPLGAAVQDPGLAMAHGAPGTDDLEILEEVMKEDGFQPDPAPEIPKSLPKLIPRGSDPGAAREPPLARGLRGLSLSPVPGPRWCPGTGGAREKLEKLEKPGKPRLVITEQPKQRGMRFRYECEGRSAGSILGENSTEGSRTLPSIELQNCQGIPEVTVTACLVWKDWPHRVHPHGLVGKDCAQGLCRVLLRPQSNPRHSFSNLGIQCVKKKEIEGAIEKKLQLGIDPFKAGSLRNHQEVDLNVVRICFQASFRDRAGIPRSLSPVLSQPIFDKKSTNTSELRICRMNKESGPCTGGEELYLLCDKVQKEDIAVIFRRESWEARADFSQADVHRQVAIVLRTPPYAHLELREPVQVEVFLQRLTDSVRSEGFRFTYLPKDTDAYGVQVKRKRGMPDVLEELSGSDPFGIEAKRRKKPPGYLEHFLPLGPSAAALPPEPEPLDPLPPLLPPFPPSAFPAFFPEFAEFPEFFPPVPELLAEPPSGDPPPISSLVGSHMFPGGEG